MNAHVTRRICQCGHSEASHGPEWATCIACDCVQFVRAKTLRKKRNCAAGRRLVNDMVKQIAGERRMFL